MKPQEPVRTQRHSPEPSQNPTPNTISRGWNARLLVFGANGVKVSRAGGTDSVAVSEPISLLDASERTSDRWDRQFAAVSDDVLHRASAGTGDECEAYNIRCEDFGLLMDIKRGKPMGEHVPCLQRRVTATDVP